MTETGKPEGKLGLEDEPARDGRGLIPPSSLRYLEQLLRILG